ncbi:hypothetical protein BDR03DRAFT_969253 [Suillus americanus]|nr:hypothetical protein BDR03DRAFT_969253 [Suillus americanus]
MEKLSAPTSNLPAHSTSRILFNYSSGRLNESSTVLAPGVHSLDKPFQCMWDVAHRLHCNALIRGYNISSHLREVHGIHGSDKCRNMCIWNGCNRELKKESLLRHVEEVHLRIVYSCDCGNTYSRRDTLNRHQRSCTVRQ